MSLDVGFEVLFAHLHHDDNPTVSSRQERSYRPDVVRSRIWRRISRNNFHPGIVLLDDDHVRDSLVEIIPIGYRVCDLSAPTDGFGLSGLHLR